MGNSITVFIVCRTATFEAFIRILMTLLVAEMIAMSLVLMNFSSAGRCQNSFCDYSIHLCQYFFLCGGQLAMVTHDPLTVLNFSETFLQ